MGRVGRRQGPPRRCLGAPLTRAGDRPWGWQGRPPGHRPGVRRIARRGCEVSAILVVGLRDGRQPLRLVLYLSGDLLEFRLELAAVVGAEEQFTAAQQDDAQVCLGAAAVAAISGRQGARGGQNSSHVASSLARRAVVPGSTSNQAENVPARGFSSNVFSEAAVCCRLAANVPYYVSYVSYGFALSVRSVVRRLGCRLFMRTCPEPKWFMPGRERDVYFTQSRDRTCVRPWTSVSCDEGGVTTALPGLGTL